MSFVILIEKCKSITKNVIDFILFETDFQILNYLLD